MGRFLWFSFVLLLVGVTHADLTPQDYWKTMLPNTPMPNSISELLRPDMAIGPESLANIMGLDARTQIYHQGTTRPQSISEENIFFLEKDLRPGSKMRLNFTRCYPAVALIPRRAASSIPFSLGELHAVFNYFSIRPNSAEANIMTVVVNECERTSSEEERKHCATSLESMVDFVSSTLGTRDLQTLSSQVVREGALKQDYVISSSPQEKFPWSSSIICHPVPYPYTVFYCHVTSATKAYVVPVVGKDGVKLDAVAVCHRDTSRWNADNLVFQMLKVKPGEVPVCHFLAKGGLVWAPIAIRSEHF